MNLYRVFDWDGRARGREPNGPLFSPRTLQGPGRHDVPDRDGILYCSLSPVSAIAESIQVFKGLTITNEDFVRSDGRRRTITAFSLSEKVSLLDLRDSKILAARHIPAAHVTTRDYTLTRHLSAALYDEGVPGFLWISALEARWTHASLFASRVRSHLKLLDDPRPLTVDLPELVEAAKILAVHLEK